MGLPANKQSFITNLQYDDNTILIGRVDIKDAIVWKWILQTFELWSGLKINYNKSHIIFMGELNVDNVITEKIMGCTREGFPIKYLGVPLRGTKLRKENWTVIIEGTKKN